MQFSYTNGTTLLDDQSAGTSLRCFSCPTRAICPLGGAVVVPEPGAWHSGAGSTAMLPCFNPASCRLGDKAAQYALVDCLAAWWGTYPPGLNPHRLPDGRLCLVDGPGSTPAMPGGNHSTAARRYLALASSPDYTAWNTSAWVTYTDLQCVERSMGPLCGACEPGCYATSKRECVPCDRKPGYHAGIGFVMLILNMVLVLIIGACQFLIDFKQLIYGMAPEAISSHCAHALCSAIKLWCQRRGP